MASNVTEGELTLQAKMSAQKKKLQEILESNFELLPKLVSSGALTHDENEEIETERTTSRKNKALLDVIFENGKQQEFITALRDSDQIHVVNWIEGNGVYKDEFGLDWPQTEREAGILQHNFEALTTSLDTVHGFLDILYSKSIISKLQMDFVSSKKTSFDRAKAFLDILRRFSLKKYFQTAECLQVSTQDHIAEILVKGGVLVAVHSTQEAQNTEEAEIEIVQEMTRLLRERNASLEPTDLTRLFARLLLKVGAVRQGESIVLYVCCYERKEFDRLCAIVDNDELMEILDWFFSLLLRINQAKVLLVKIAEDDADNARRWFESEEHRDKKLDEHFRELQSLLRHEMESMESTVTKEEEKLYPDKSQTMEVCPETEIAQTSEPELLKKCEAELEERGSQASMTDEEIIAAIFRNNSDFFRECIKPETVIRKLSSLGILSDDSRRYIRSMKNKNDKNAELVNVVRASSVENYHKFITCLRETDQDVVANVAEKGGVVVKVKIVHNPISNITKIEQELVTRLAQLHHHDQASSKTEDLWRFLSRLKMGGMEVIGARQDGGILVWMWCRSSRAVTKLEKLSGEEKLGDVFSALFRLLVSEVDLKIKSIYLESTDVDFVSRRLCKWLFPPSPTNVGRKITGMAMLGDKIFIVCQDENTLMSFSCDEDGNCTKDKEVALKDLKAPTHIAASVETQCLYIADGSDNVVWKYGIGPNGELGYPKVWLGPSPNQISSLVVGRNDNLLVLRQKSRRLECYRAGQRVTLGLPERIVNPHHVAEASPDGDFIISYGGAESNPGGICRITREGQWVFRFDLGSTPIKTLSHEQNSVMFSVAEDLEFMKVVGNFTFDDEDQLLYVCSEERMVVLDSELSIEIVDRRSGPERPCRIHCANGVLLLVHGAGQNLLSVATKE